MLLIGLTGGIGSGKTTVCNCFSALNTPIIDADLIAREVVMPGTPGLTQIIDRFGQHILAQDGTLDRGKLREQIFSDTSSRRELEAILHPLIRQQVVREQHGLGLLQVRVPGHDDISMLLSQVDEGLPERVRRSR